MSERPKNAFGVSLDRLEVEQRNRLRRAVAAAHGLDDVDLGVREGGLQVGGADLGASSVPVVALERPRHELDAVALRFPPGDAPLDLGPPGGAGRPTSAGTV